MRPAAVVSALALIVACRAGSEPNSELSGPLLNAAGKPMDTNARANLVWADVVPVDGSVVPAGIRGDGRLKTGVAASGSPSNEYQGAFCGVSAFLATANNGSGELNFDPDTYYSSTMQATCGAARSYHFYLAGAGAAPTVSGPHSIARGLALLGPGQSAVQFEGFGLQLPTCQRVMYNDSTQYAPSNSPLQTRLPDLITPTGTVRQWRVESRGTHMGVCVTYNKNGSVKSVGPGLFMPFSLTVTEVPSPFPTFP